MAGKGSAPGEHRGGRKKGTPNKFTGEIKDMIRAALDEAGGKDYLLAQSKTNAVAFMSLLGKVIPADVNTKITGNINWPLPKTKLDE